MEVYRQAIEPLIGRALSTLDWEFTSPSYGSFDRTWWCWKFTDFAAPRFQEGAYLLAWLLTSPNAPARVGRSSYLLDGAGAAIRFWARLQHADGSFDEAYPFERSLAATAFTGFYLGSALERLVTELRPADSDLALAAIRRGAQWLAGNGEYHGVLSNHLAAAAAALQIAGDLLGTDRFQVPRDRYLDIVAREQHPSEGWLREYNGADPGYQSHAMFYLAEIERRTGSSELFALLSRAADFQAWFAHPDGSLGGEHASRGTKFTYPAAFEMLAGRIPAAAALAAHARACMLRGRGVGAAQMDAWNQFPLLNNLLFAADAAGPLNAPPPLPWQEAGQQAIFKGAGLAIVKRAGRVVALSGSTGGVVKAWDADTLLYEDCGYAVATGRKWAVSQGPASSFRFVEESDALRLDVTVNFTGRATARFSPWTFIGFRVFTMTIGRLPVVARWLKRLLVDTLVHSRGRQQGRLSRTIRVYVDGSVSIDDEIENVSGPPQAIGRQVPFHMGSSRYIDRIDAIGPAVPCLAPEGGADGNYKRTITLNAPTATA